MDSDQRVRVVTSKEEALLDMMQAVFQVPRDGLTDEASPDTIAVWDSLKHIQLVLALEAEFGVSLTPEDVLQMKNLGLIKAILCEKGITF